jgi:hypothetical protein
MTLMRKITYREAVREALKEALERDERVFLMGEDVGRYGGAYACSKGLLQEFGEQRIRDTPLSESGFVGAGIGAALGGMRPIVEIMTVNFSLLAPIRSSTTPPRFAICRGASSPCQLSSEWRRAPGASSRPSTRIVLNAGSRMYRGSRS